MSASESTVTYEWRQFSHRRTVVDAVQHDGTEHCRRWIAKAVGLVGGTVMDRADGQLFILGARGFLPLQPGEWCVRSIDVPGRGREFFPMGDDILTEAYDPLGGPDRGATLTRDQAAAIVVAADHIGDECRDLIDLRTREMVQSLVEYVHQLATALEADR